MGYTTDESTDGTAEHTVDETQSQKIRNAHLAVSDTEKKKPDAKVTIEIENGNTNGEEPNDAEHRNDSNGAESTAAKTGDESVQSGAEQGGEIDPETGLPVSPETDEDAVETDDSPHYPEPSGLSESEMNQNPGEILDNQPEFDSPLWKDEKEKEDIAEVSEYQEDRIKEKQDQGDIYSNERTTGDGVSEILPPKAQNRVDEPIMDSKFPEGESKKPRKLSADIDRRMRRLYERKVDRHDPKAPSYDEWLNILDKKYSTMPEHLKRMMANPKSTRELEMVADVKTNRRVGTLGK